MLVFESLRTKSHAPPGLYVIVFEVEGAPQGSELRWTIRMIPTVAGLAVQAGEIDPLTWLTQRVVVGTNIFTQPVIIFSSHFPAF
jgi:hypothetical protein